MAFEDFSAYVVQDTNSRLTFDGSNTNITATNMPGSEQIWVYKDFGVGFFTATDFTHRYKFKPITNAGTIGVATSWLLSNDIADYFTHLASKTFFAVQNNTGASVAAILIEEQSGIRRNTASVAGLTLNVQYYLEVKRVGNLMALTVYTDSGYTVVHGTNSWTVFNTTQTFRYFYPPNNWNNPASTSISNLTMGEYDLGLGVIQIITPDPATMTLSEVVGGVFRNIPRVKGATKTIQKDIKGRTIIRNTKSKSVQTNNKGKSIQ